ncbi:MAG: G8 domain-containing protein, partial [Candidatus Dormibacteria bacterium]
NVNTLVVVANFVVLEGGTLQIGTAANPVAANVTANIEFSDTLLDTTTDPQQFGNGLIGLGTVTMHGATLSDSFVALASEPKAGDATLSLSQPVTGWKAGDLLVLPDTRELTYQERMSKYVPQWEQLTIASVSADGKRLALTAPLHFDHLGARDATGALRYLPHVGDLTRNVNLMSVNPAGNRGWVMFTDRANVDIQDVAFEGTGRTQLAAIDDTTFDASGNVTHMGTNQDDRNPVTFRNLNGPATAQANGYQYMFRGNSVYCPMSAAPTAIWGINVDNSHYGLIQDNFVYAWAGAGIVTQTGAETGNVFDHNFVVRIPGTGARVDDAGTAGDGFWFRGVTNTVTNNVVANAYSVRDFYSYGYDVYAYFLGKVTIPAAQGDDPTLPGQSLTIDGNAQPLGTFFGDVAYGVPSGMTFWWISAYYKSPDGTSPSTIKDFTVWHQWEWGIFAYESSNVTLDGYVDLGDFGLPSLPDLATGIWFSDYVTRGFTITNADIEGQIEGVLLPQAADGVTIVKNSHFANLVDVDDPTTFSTDQPILLPAKSADLANDQFDPWPGRPLTAVQMEWSLNQNRNAIQLDTLF